MDLWKNINNKEVLVQEVVKTDRTAIIYKDNYGYYVRLFEEGSGIVVTRDVGKHSLEYAQDLAWNWVDRIIP